MTVTGQGISMGSFPASVGAGLHASHSITLGTAEHERAERNHECEFLRTGVEGASNSITVTATAPGFTNGSGTLTVMQPSIKLVSLTNSYSATAANMRSMHRSAS